jgi:hypothetical protein
LLRVKKRLELRLDFRVEVFETLAAMANHRRTKRLEGFLADFDGSGYVEFDVCHKGREIFHKPGQMARKLWPQM